MRWNERLQIALPELTRPDKRTLLTGLPVGTVVAMAANHAEVALSTPVLLLLGFPCAKLLFWTSDLLHKERLRSISIQRHTKAYRRGLEQIKRLRKSGGRPGSKGFIPDMLRKKDSPLKKEDIRLLERIEMHVCQIENQFLVLDAFLQQHLLHVLPQVIAQGTEAMEVGQKLAVLLEFLSKEDLERLEREEQILRDVAKLDAVGPLDTLHSQTCRFKAQQIENIRKAGQTAALYRAQLHAIEAGLGNVRGRMASMSALEHAQIGYEMEALDAELTAIHEGMEMAARVTGGEFIYAGSAIPQTPRAETGSYASAPPRPEAQQTTR